MKKVLFVLFVFLCVGLIARADTITLNWLNENGTVNQTTTCESGGDLILPATPTKNGYTFQGWKIQNYIQIEYLESTGTQYIDTGIITDNNVVSIDMDIKPIDIDKTSYFCKTRSTMTNAGEAVGLGITFGSWSMLLPGYSYNYFGTASTNRVQISWTITLNGTSAVTGNLNKTTTDPTFFGANLIWRQDTWKLMKDSYIDFYTCKIYLNNTLVRDFIPVLDPNGTPCLYDKVTKQFFYNQGTGQFIAGPVVNQ